MDPLPLITERVPVDPGEGPFKVRGMYYARPLSRAGELNEMPRVLASQFDFGELEVEAYEPGRITVSIAQMARILAPAVVNVLVGAHGAVLDLIGSPSHRVRYEVARDGQQRGYEAVRATLNGVWVVP